MVHRTQTQLEMVQLWMEMDGRVGVELLKGTSVRGQLHAIYLYQALEQQSGILGNVNTGTTNKVE